VSSLGDLLGTWKSVANTSIGSPASADDFAEAKREMKQPLPPAILQLYQVLNGGYLLEGNLTLYPLSRQQEGCSLTDGSGFLRRCGWDIPESLLVFADNGAGHYFAAYTGSAISPWQCPIVEVGELFEPGCLALAGTDLLRFLVGYTAYYLLVLERPDLLRSLGVPTTFERVEPDDESFAALRAWADPALPNPMGDPYIDRLDPRALATIVGGA
jgi:hypothetical protein